VWWFPIGTIRTPEDVEALKLLRLFVFSWWIGSGDLHLKNLALVTDPEGLTRLSPCYDLLSTRLVIPDDDLALSVDGRRGNLNRASWLRFAESSKIPARAAERVLAQPALLLQSALALVAASALGEELQASYCDLLTTRADFR
jgi:serine/threonine-protein kinase HipA